MTNEDNKDILHTRALDTVKKRLGNLWSSTLQDPSSLKNELSTRLNGSDQDLLGYVTSLTPSMHTETSRQGDPNKWVNLINAGAESPTEQGQDSFLSLATELVGGDENFQALAKKQSEGYSSTVTIILNPDTNLTADIQCKSGFNSSGKDVDKFYPQMVNISVPTHFTPSGSESPINPAAELVSSAIRGAFVAEVV